MQTVFKANLNSLEKIFDKISQLSLEHRLIGAVAKEFSEIDEGFASIKTIVELRKALKTLKSKTNRILVREDINKENDRELTSPTDKLHIVPSYKKESSQCEDCNDNKTELLKTVRNNNFHKSNKITLIASE